MTLFCTKIKQEAKKINRKDKGSILVISLMILSIVLASGLSMALLAIRQSNLSIKSSKTNVAYQTADGGLEDIMSSILKTLTVDDYTSGTSAISVNRAVTQHLSAYFCDSASGMMTLGDNKIKLKDGAGSLVFCNSSADISTVYSIEVIGADSQRSTQRSVEAILTQQDPKIKLLMHMDTDTAAPTFVDASRTHKSIGNNNTTASTATLPESYFKIDKNYSAADFNGSTSYFSLNNSLYYPDWSFAGNTFSVDMYVYFKSISSAQNFVSMGNVNYFSVGVIGAPINILQVYIGGLPYNFAWTPALNTWYHLVVKRDGSNSLSATATDAALGDVQLGSPQNCSANISISAIGLNVGTNSGANGNFFNGYMDDLRVCSPVCSS